LDREEFIPLSEAAAISGLSLKHLGLLARRGMLPARKIGRNWQCSDARAWVDFGISAHQSTGSVVPHDPAWDQTWIGHYQRIETLLGQLCA
jgi:hypothetical protein